MTNENIDENDLITYLYIVSVFVILIFAPDKFTIQ